MKEKISYLVNGIEATVQGFYKVAIVDSATDKVVWEMPEFRRNLILNGGMDLPYSTRWPDLLLYGIVGTGTRPNSYSSGATTASQTTTAVTSAGGTHDFTVSAAAGDVILWDSGPQATVVSVTNANTLVVSPSQSVSSGTFVVWKTSQTGLQTEVKRSNTYLGGTGNCGSTIAPGGVVGKVSHLRTIDFAAETGSVTYTEVGVSPVGTANTQTFSRILLGSPVALTTGQRLRLVYQLNIQFSPTTANSKTAAISGWPVTPATDTSGTEQLQAYTCAVVSSVAGNTDTTSYGLGLEPSETSLCAIWIAPSSSALATTMGSSVPNRGVTGFTFGQPTKAAYTNGSWTCDKTYLFDVSVGNFTTLRSMGISGYLPAIPVLPQDPQMQALTFLFNQNQTKTNTQTLSLTFRYLWSRTLA